MANYQGSRPSANHTVNGFGVLRSVLERAREKAGCSLTDLTVLSAQVDPYRLDTPSGHPDGKWLAKQLEKAIGKDKPIHWRGLHYALVAVGNIVKPNGEIWLALYGSCGWLFGSRADAVAEVEGGRAMIRCVRFRPYQKNTLKGFVDLELTRAGLMLHDCTWHEKDGKQGVVFPARTYQDKEGKTQWQPLIEFAEGARDAREQFVKQAIEAIHQAGAEQEHEAV